MIQEFVARLSPEVDKTVASLAKERFRPDPIAGDRFSRATSIVSSAYKRHGRILEIAIRERLRECEYFTVWAEPAFSISETADRTIRGRNSDIAESLPIALPYGAPGRVLQVDAIVYDRRVKTLRAYEIKRGNGYYDSGKKRSILRDILCIQALLKNYGETRSLEVSVAEVKLVSYYGIRALPGSLNISGDEVDDHFVFAIKRYVDAVNDYFQSRLHDLLVDVLGLTALERASLCGSCPLHERPHLAS